MNAGWTTLRATDVNAADVKQDGREAVYACFIVKHRGARMNHVVPM
ncbi:hypothetical protein [Paenibacillus alkalitolerans]|nr:hypothetical protein [Paenibacillus alkalitolerans]